jgi:bacillithiol biosynthesis deacetylase BshB1
MAFGAHPDDVELFCSGTLVKLKSSGFKTGVVDLTKGELSTNGDEKTRQKEAEKASDILNLDIRLNLSIPDGNISKSLENRGKIVHLIRKYRPSICFVPYWEDRHPDHIDASLLVQRALFEAGLSKFESPGVAYRPRTVLFYMMHTHFNPSFIVDISDEIEVKNRAINAFESQFSISGSTTIPTYINQNDFLKYLTHRAAYFGFQIGVEYGEGFYTKEVIKINNIMEIFS